jgi:hypothetical protein
MEELQGENIELKQWSDWLALDLSADMTYSQDEGQVRNSEYTRVGSTFDLMMNLIFTYRVVKDSTFLKTTLKLNRFLTLSQISRKFNFAMRVILTPLVYLAIPPSTWFAIPTLLKKNSKDFQQRIDRRGNTEQLDYVEQVLPFDKPVPEKKELFHIQNVAGQLLLASWQPLANQFYTIILFLLKEPDVYAALVLEVRAVFSSDVDEITLGNVAGDNLRYLQACVSEGLRLHTETTDGLPRVSPGAVVDGHYVPERVSFSHIIRCPKKVIWALSASCRMGLGAHTIA